MTSFETVLYDLSAIFLYPAMAAILLALGYAVFSLGAFMLDHFLRRRADYRSPLFLYFRETAALSDDLELWIMRRLELLRMTSRISPLLGLVATLIPMGPALLALTENDAASVGKNMVVAFAGVTLALIAASIAFFVLNVRRRWLFEELRDIEKNHMQAGGEG